jgi:hypothetical protein
MSLKEGAAVWCYSFGTTLRPSAKPTGILAGCSLGKPMLMVRVKPDPQNKDNVGIAVNLLAYWSAISWTKGEEPAKAHVEVKDEKGNAVLAEDVELDNMSFG